MKNESAEISERPIAPTAENHGEQTGERIADRQINKATAYCTYCPKLCRFSCPAAEAESRETVTPWGMMRLLELVNDGSVEPDEEVTETFYHCMGCRRCQTWCLHENDVPHAMWAARESMRELGYLPEALRGLDREFLKYNSAHGEAPEIPPIHGFTVEEVFDPEASVIYMPDPHVRYHDPKTIVRVGILLEMFHGTKIRLYTRQNGSGFGGSGFPLLSTGNRTAYEDYRARLEEALSGADLVVTESAEMVAEFREGNSFGRKSSLQVVHIIEFLAARIEMIEPRVDLSDEAIMLHDSCLVGRHLDLYEETRTLLTALCSGPMEEFSTNRADAPCCGAVGEYDRIAPEASARLAANRVEQMRREGGEKIVCGQAMCSRAMNRVDGTDVALDVVDLVCRAFEL
jgi:Fe-S oxidoreductase